jgi:dynein heavy chain, axonemal
MKKIEFTKEKSSKEIIGMWSSEFEYVAFTTPVMAIGPVEHWLTKIEYMMCQSLYDCTKTALHAYPADGTERSGWLFTTAAQPILTIDMLKWTDNVEIHIRQIMKGEDSNALKVFLEFSIKQLNNMIQLVRSKLEPLQRTAMGALIVLDVHARTVVQNMVKSRVSHINDFDWSSQLRYYWEALIEGYDGEPYQGDEGTECDVFAKQTNTRFRYGYEYLGNGPRLVITPLTDQCYMTLTGALHLNFGGNPAGPAGTGKTETTKDLAKALAVQCVVFNCSDGLDFRMMGRFFTGLASGGAWSCFDEFNRIDIEVLSVIAQQILTIQSAVRGRLKEFDFEGKIIPLNLRFGVFITMNPGYAGRTELPDNLKALFRPMAMMIPDYRLIAEIILYSEGFGTAEMLSKKMVKLYSLSSEQLSKQDHYDFGMRAVKSVLVMAGKLRRKDDSVPEDILLIRAMRDSNVPKFLEHDLPLFSGIVEDLFPGVVVPRVDYGKLKEEILN